MERVIAIQQCAHVHKGVNVEAVSLAGRKQKDVLRPAQHLMWGRGEKRKRERQNNLIRLQHVEQCRSERSGGRKGTLNLERD